MSSQEFWRSCLSYFRNKLQEQQFENWIKPLVVAEDDDRIVLHAPNSFVVKIIQERFLADINRLANDHFSCRKQIEVKSARSYLIENKKRLNTISSHLSIPSSETIVEPVFRKNSNRLNPVALFENFVTGKANQLAHAAAMQVAESPGSIYNPLFIYGGVGLGKTHLLHAIGNHFAKNNSKANICYIHATNYISDVVKAVQTKRFDELKQFYNSLDLLLIDDIQFIADKPGTQQEFFYTLNALIDGNKQVVITCDTFPKEIKGIEQRLTSRFICGLTVAIEPPDLEMRVAILLQKSVLMGNPIEEEVAFFIAKNVRSNVRELEGALNRVEAYARFHMKPICVDVAKEALKDLLSAQNKQVSIENIQKTVSDFYRIKLVDLLSKKRPRLISRPRQVAMYLARELTQLSLPEIGNAFGGRDHSTVLHACKNIEKLRNTEAALAEEIKLLNQTLRN